MGMTLMTRFFPWQGGRRRTENSDFTPQLRGVGLCSGRYAAVAGARCGRRCGVEGATRASVSRIRMYARSDFS